MGVVLGARLHPILGYYLQYGGRGTLHPAVSQQVSLWLQGDSRQARCCIQTALISAVSLYTAGNRVRESLQHVLSTFLRGGWYCSNQSRSCCVDGGLHNAGISRLAFSPSFSLPLTLIGQIFPCSSCHSTMWCAYFKQFLFLSLQLLVEFDDTDWKRREWIRIHEIFQIFLVEHQLLWAPRADPDKEKQSKQRILWPSLVSN